MGFLSRRSIGKGTELALRGESPSSFRVVERFLLSYDGDLRDPLVGPHRGLVSTRAPRGPSGFLCSHCRGRGPPLVLRLETQVSSPEPTWISGFLWGVHR